MEPLPIALAALSNAGLDGRVRACIGGGSYHMSSSNFHLGYLFHEARDMMPDAASQPCYCPDVDAASKFTGWLPALGRLRRQAL